MLIGMVGLARMGARMFRRLQCGKRERVVQDRQPQGMAGLYARFAPRSDADFANRLQSALRHDFGGHLERPIVDLRART